MIFHRKKKLESYQQSDPNEKFVLSLNELKWVHQENPVRKKAQEIIKYRHITNFELRSKIKSMNDRFQLDGYTYSKYPNYMERKGPSIVCKGKHNPFWRIVKA